MMVVPPLTWPTTNKNSRFRADRADFRQGPLHPLAGSWHTHEKDTTPETILLTKSTPTLSGSDSLELAEQKYTFICRKFQLKNAISIASNIWDILIHIYETDKKYLSVDAA